MARRPVAGVAAVVLVAEAIGIVLAQIFLGMVVDDQQMSLAGLEPRAMTVGAVAGGVLFGGYLLLCAAVLLRMALRDRPPRPFFRILLISAAVVHGVLGAFTVGLVGWSAFVLLMTVLGLIVWSLVAYGEENGGPAEPEATASPSSGNPPAAPAG
ncbi:hypothetical protein [Streptomyces sp. JJ36]|uniref:hypothetical protein n=1 Tax=Streptomyces sp. JJ36 TaxID=2736645 RepID=UPI001F1BE907|nr:hypothetical protein [Streptomyces sp. JJ36]